MKVEQLNQDMILYHKTSSEDAFDTINFSKNGNGDLVPYSFSLMVNKDQWHKVAKATRVLTFCG